MTLENIYIFILIILSLWGMSITVLLIMNSLLRREFRKTKELIENINLEEIKLTKPSPVYLSLKRFFDIIFAFAALIAILPVSILIAFLIKLETPGPLFAFGVRQKRIGLNGRPFTMLKFRTIKIKNEETADKQFLSYNDERITRIGRFLRRTAMDEFPAFWNVIKGDISIIGRSRILEYPDVADTIKPELREALLSIKPGIANLWAVSYERQKNNPQKLLLYDLYYLSNMSFKLDLMILWRTIVQGLAITAGW